MPSSFFASFLSLFPLPSLIASAVIALFCKQYDIIKDNDSNNNKEKTKPSSEHSTPERPAGGLLRSKVSLASERRRKRGDCVHTQGDCVGERGQESCAVLWEG